MKSRVDTTVTFTPAVKRSPSGSPDSSCRLRDLRHGAEPDPEDGGSRVLGQKERNQREDGGPVLCAQDFW